MGALRCCYARRLAWVRRVFPQSAMCRRSDANAERHTWRRLDSVATARGKNRAVAVVVLPATSNMASSFMDDSLMSPCGQN